MEDRYAYEHEAVCRLAAAIGGSKHFDTALVSLSDFSGEEAVEFVILQEVLPLCDQI